MLLARSQGWRPGINQAFGLKASAEARVRVALDGSSPGLLCRKPNPGRGRPRPYPIRPPVTHSNRPFPVRFVI